MNEATRLTDSKSLSGSFRSSPATIQSRQPDMLCIAHQSLQMRFLVAPCVEAESRVSCKEYEVNPRQDSLAIALAFPLTEKSRRYKTSER